MKKWWLAGGASALAAVALVGFDRPTPRAMPLFVGSDAPGPLLGMVSGGDAGGPTTLVRLDPVRLRRLPGRSVVVGSGGAWAYSPGRALLTVAARQDKRSDRLRFVDVRRMRLRPPAVSIGAIVMALAWVEPSRLLVLTQNCCAGENGIVVVDPKARRVLAQTALPHRVLSLSRVGSRLVLLEAPGDSIGAASLAIVSAEGDVRRVVLDRIAAGSEWPDGSDAPPIGRWIVPGLAVDPAGRAYVAGADRIVGEVDLDSLNVRYHQVSTASSLAGRLRRWFEPNAEAKGVDGPTRRATWLGDGLIAVTGDDQTAFLDSEGGFHASGRPSGLEIVDVRAWTARVLEPAADAVVPAGTLLLATGSSWSADPDSQTRSGIGLAAYGFKGESRFRVLGGRAAWVAFVVGGRAYVGADDERPLWVVDLASGRIVGRRTDTVTWPLLGDASPFWG